MSANGSSLQTQAVAATAGSFSKPTPTFCAWSQTWNEKAYNPGQLHV